MVDLTLKQLADLSESLDRSGNDDDLVPVPAAEARALLAMAADLHRWRERARKRVTEAYGRDLLDTIERLHGYVERRDAKIASLRADLDASRRLPAYDEGGLPVHLPMPVNAEGQGPLDDSETPARIVCWCADSGCMWTKALDQAQTLGARGEGGAP